MSEKLEGTSFDGKSASEDADVDALIAGALKEIEIKKDPEKTAPEKVLQATPMAPAKIEKIEEKHPLIEMKDQKPAQPAKNEPPKNEYEDSFKNFAVGAIVQGTIVRLDHAGAMVDIGYKSDGWISPEELTPGLKIGDTVKVLIEKLENKEGHVVLSKKNAEYESKWQEIYEAYKNRTLLEAKVTSAVKGGLVADCGGIRGFIPASQVSKRPEQTLEEFVGKTIGIKVIEINQRQGKVILSHKLGAFESGKKEASKILDELEVGQVKHGIVKNLKQFGAFVDIGGIEGLIHLSELSWKRVKHPSDVLKSGQEIDVFVIGVDKIHNKVSLGLKQLQQDPWAAAAENYKAGQIVKVKVLRLAKFGAFVEIEEGLEGLIHISELSKDKITSPDQAVNPGDIVEAKILRIAPDEQRVGLSIKEVQIEKEKSQAEEQKTEESKVTIGEMIAEKERAKAERVAEFSEDEIPPEA